MPETDPWETLEGIVKKVPKEEDVYLAFFMQKPHKGSLGKMYVDRNRDLREQSVEYFEEKRRLRNFVEAKVNVRGAGRLELGGCVVYVPLATETPAPRVENPVQPTTGASLSANLGALRAQLEEIKELRKLTEGECKDCHEPLPNCTCEVEDEDDDCPDCGFAESQCKCDDDEESATEAVAKEFLAKGGGEVLETIADSIVDLIRAGGERLRHGPRPAPPDGTTPPTLRAVAEPAKKTGAA